MEMSVKIKLSSGKEIELTKEEYDELKDSFAVEKEVQRWFPYYPYYPNEINIPSVWYNEIGDTCLRGGITITSSSSSKEEGRHINNWD